MLLNRRSIYVCSLSLILGLTLGSVGCSRLSSTNANSTQETPTQTLRLSVTWTATFQSTVIPKVLITETPPLTATKEAEKFVPNVGSLTWLPGEGNRMGDTLELGEGAPDYFRNQIIGSILAGHAKLIVRNDTSLLSKDPGTTFTNDQWIKENFNVDPNDLDAFMKALEENNYVMPEGFLLPYVGEPSTGGSDVLWLEQSPEFKLDTVVIQLCDQSEFQEKRLAAFDSDPSNDESSIKNGTFVMENVWNSQGGEGYVYGIKLQEFPDGYKRLVLMFAAINDLPWREAGINADSPSAPKYVEQWLNFFPFVFNNMKNAIILPGSDGKIPSIYYFNNARDRVTTNNLGQPTWGWDGNYNRTATSHNNLFVSQK